VKAVKADNVTGMPRGGRHQASPCRAAPASPGFTLLEVLVALVLLTVFSVTAYRALDAVLQAERHATSDMARWRQLSLAFARIEADLGNAIAGLEPRHGQARGVHAGRDEAGAAHFDLDRLLPEDRGGGVQRVGYLYRDGELRRRVWPDNAPAGTSPADTTVLAGLAELGLRYLDQAGQWRTDWSPRPGYEPLPRAVELRLRQVSGPDIRRVFLLQ
jgi:general secretion pathway protein J